MVHLYFLDPSTDRPNFRFLLMGVVLKTSGSCLESTILIGGLIDMTAMMVRQRLYTSPLEADFTSSPISSFLRGALMFNQPAKQGLWLVLMVTGDEPATGQGREQVLAVLTY